MLTEYEKKNKRLKALKHSLSYIGCKPCKIVLRDKITILEEEMKQMESAIGQNTVGGGNYKANYLTK